ncbi:UDP-Glycosyltransferase superfamily protein [Zea mays]|uniref:UDP-Glycosyltransferase superfamily protein n=1 Tax=Zea mays TaxID=4577 RepID=A0A1D6MTG7_MAIZE|nr:UDP-Glycosyltransferase superfamily protein [Zea mays]
MEAALISLEGRDLDRHSVDVIAQHVNRNELLVTLLSTSLRVMIPLPTILDHHQTRNAYIMADIMGAMVITEDELDSSSLTSAVDEIFGDEKLMADMSQKALTAARPNASADIIRHICSLIGSTYPS